MQPTKADLIDLAVQAGAILRAGYGQDHQINFKGAADLVTEVDRRSEAFILQSIRQRFADHMIITEESGLLAGKASHCWFIDPLDGTTNYAHNLPIFAVSIGYMQDGVMKLGVVYDPMRDECFSAERGQGAWLNNQPIHASTAADLGDCLLVTGFPYGILNARNNNLEYFRRFSLKSQAVRRLGSAALDLCYLAAGRFDGYWEISLKPYDIAAGSLILTEAGGIITDLQGGPTYMELPCALVAAGTPAVHAQMLAVVREELPA